MTPETVQVPATPTGPVLVLRPWADSDAEALVKVHQDPAMHRWLRKPLRNTVEAFAWLAAQQDGWRAGDRLCFAVQHDERGLVGCVVLNKPLTEPEVGYWSAAHARGLGVATRAVDALSVWAFATFGLDRIQLRHQDDNVASCRVAEKSGYAFEATLPATPPWPREGHLHTRQFP